jgi:hypothetical protein
MSAHPRLITPFSPDPDFDFEIRTVLGGGVEGASDPGEVLAAVSHVRKNDHDGWYHAWDGLGRESAATAEAAAAAGHTTSAAGAALRSATYLSVAVNATSALGDEQLLASTFRRQQDAWNVFVEHAPAEIEHVAIPYEGRTMPGLFVRAAGATGPARTLVAVNGSDGSLAGLWASVTAPAIRRGWNVLVFDGPGQQTMLFDDGVPFRPDWEHVLAPVLDFLAARSDVDADRIAAYGISQGGFWLAQALTAEHRFAAAVTDPGVVDVSTSWTAHIPGMLLHLLDGGDVERFDREMAIGMKLTPELARTWRFRARPYGTSGYGETIQTVRRYTVADTASRITTPLLILSPEGEQFWPGQAEHLADLTPGVSTLVRFTAAEGADGHCQPLGRGLTAQRMFDWLDERVPR